tara:strand:+ start:532 stop:987 length:456 start_codon:yes stop_codon:yes gene_type:complete
MGYAYKNIIGDTATTLLLLNHSDHANTNTFESRSLSSEKFGDTNTYMSLANVHDTDSVDLDLYLTASDKGFFIDSQQGRGSENLSLEEYPNMHEEVVSTNYTYYILKNVTIPIKTTLILNKEDLLFDNTVYQLKIQLSAADSAVDVVINTN